MLANKTRQLNKIGSCAMVNNYDDNSVMRISLVRETEKRNKFIREH